MNNKIYFKGKFDILKFKMHLIYAKKNKKLEILILKISKILNINKKELIDLNNFSEIETWDSLKQLEIITEIDKLYGNKLKKLKDLSKLSSIRKITKYLGKI